MVRRGLSRDGLVALAHDYVSANGLDALTMRRLAVAAQVSPGALYKHFRDKRDLQRAMADAIYATIDLADIDTGNPTVDQVEMCCERMRNAMLAFRDGGRIAAGSYAPFAAALNLSSTLLTLLQAVTLPEFSAGDIALVLRSYTTGFVTLEQAFLELRNADEWDSLVRAIAASDHPRITETDDTIAIMTGDRDQRFAAGLGTILAGTVRTQSKPRRG
jgi:AcrR family transcriptional regulator